MEYVVIGLLVVFSWFQTDRVKQVQAESDYWQEVAQANESEWRKALEVNKNNVVVIARLELALNGCSTQVADALSRANDFRAASVFKEAAIRELETRLGSTDFAQCRVPDWVDLSNP